MFDPKFVEPNAELRAGARTLHELFRAYVNEGFTRAESLELVKLAIVSAQEQNRSSGQ